MENFIFLLSDDKYRFVFDDFLILILLILGIFGLIIFIFFFFDMIEILFYNSIDYFVRLKSRKTKIYGYVNNKKIDKKSVSIFRDIPCNGDIYYANILVYLNGFNYKEENIIGAIMLKWIKDNNIIFKTNDEKNKDNGMIYFINKPKNCNKMEKELFSMMISASKDGVLSIKEFKTWIKLNSYDLINLIIKERKAYLEYLRNNKFIKFRDNKEECNCYNVMNERLYEDSKKLYGLKLFLEEYSKFASKESIEVKLWEEYMMFAYLFGIADKISKQFDCFNIDYDILKFINISSSRSIFVNMRMLALKEKDIEE